MNCNDMRPLLQPLIDDELAGREIQEIQQHLHRCTECQEQYQQITQLRSRIAQTPDFNVPTSLQTKILNDLDSQHPPLQDLARLEFLPITAQRRAITWLSSFTTHTAAASIGALALYGVLIFSNIHTTSTDEILTAHVSSLMGQQITQVTSNDRHTVAPWFAGKLNFAPPVRDLGSYGFRLIGGRVDYLTDQKVAALVYARRKHTINLFVAPISHGNRINGHHSSMSSRNGYNVVTWQNADFRYSAISDLSEGELSTFATLFESD